MYTGLTGLLKVWDEETGIDGGYVAVAYISGFSVEDSSEVVEVKKVGQVHRDAYAGFQSWSAAANGVASFEADGQAKLFKAKHLGAKVRLELYLRVPKHSDSDNPEICFLGSGYIESLSVDLSAEGAANISISIKGAGELDLRSNGVSIKTGKSSSEPKEIFILKVTEAGDLYAVTPVSSPYRFTVDKGDEANTLKVLATRR